MPLYDYECPDCGELFESIESPDVTELECHCGDMAKRIISVGGTNCLNEDAEWIRSVVQVIDKKSRNPRTREFLEHPNRTNLRRHLESSGLRHAEPGERLGEFTNKFDVNRHVDRLVQERQRKNRVEVGG